MAGYIGNSPSDSSVRIARQIYTTSGVTTDFTFTSGYDPGYIDIYVNGERQTEGTNFTASDGQTFTIMNGGVSTGSTVECAAYKTFNVATVTLGEVTDVDDLTITGQITAGSGDIGIATIHSSGIDAGVGVITAASFVGAISKVTVADESSDTSCNVLFTTAATGDLAPKSGTNLTFNSSSGALTATSFVGDVTGDVSGSSGSCTGNAATATVANGLNLSPNITVGNVTSVNVTNSKQTTSEHLNITGVSTFTGAVTTANTVTVQKSGAADIKVGSTDAGGARIFLDGDSNGDFIGSDYSSIVHNTDGNLVIKANAPGTSNCYIQVGGDGDYAARFTEGGSAELRYDNTKRLETTAHGAITSGIHTVTVGTDLDGYKVEEGSVDTNALNGEFDFELENGHVQTHTGTTAGNYFPDFRVSSSQSLHSVMDVGDVISVTLMVASSSHYCTTGIKIDNSTSAIDIDWIGGVAPSAANGSGYDIYAFTIQKTASTPAYHIIGNALGAA